MASTQSTIRIVPTGHPKRVKSELMRQRLRAAGWFLVLALVRPRDRRMDTVARDWRRFCAALARAGVKEGGKLPLSVRIDSAAKLAAEGRVTPRLVPFSS